MISVRKLNCENCNEEIIGWTKDLISVDKLYNVQCGNNDCNIKNHFYPKSDFFSDSPPQGAVKMNLS